MVLGRRLRPWGVGGLAGVLALLAVLVVAIPPAPAATGLTHIQARLGNNCLEGYSWPAGAQVNVTVKDGGGNPVYGTSATVDPSGHFVVNIEANNIFCDIPVTLAPGMTFTASDGSTTKSLLLESVSFDQLDSTTQTAAGTAPTGSRAQVSVYWDALSGDPNAHNVYVSDVLAGDGHWSVDVRAKGGQVDSTSRGDLFLPDDGADGNFDFTVASIFVTAVNLSASAPPGGASSAVARAAPGGSAHGQSVLLSGRLTAGDRVCTKKKRVQLLRLAGRKSKVLASSRTTKKGRYSFRRNVRRTTSFKVRFRGDRICQRSESRTRTVRR
jgi:hypothetical protein